MKETKALNAETLKELLEIQSAREWERATANIINSLVFALECAPPEIVRGAMQDTIMLQQFFITLQGEEPYSLR